MHSRAYGITFASMARWRRGEVNSLGSGRKTLLIALRCFPFCSLSVREREKNETQSQIPPRALGEKGRVTGGRRGLREELS